MVDSQSLFPKFQTLQSLVNPVARPSPDYSRTRSPLPRRANSNRSRPLSESTWILVTPITFRSSNFIPPPPTSTSLCTGCLKIARPPPRYGLSSTPRPGLHHPTPSTTPSFPDPTSTRPSPTSSSGSGGFPSECPQTFRKCLGKFS